MTILNQESSSTEQKNKKFHRFVIKEEGLIDGVDLGVNGSIMRSWKNEAWWTFNYSPVHMHTYYGFLINISFPFDLDFAKFSFPDHIISWGKMWPQVSKPSSAAGGSPLSGSKFSSGLCSLWTVTKLTALIISMVKSALWMKSKRGCKSQSGLCIPFETRLRSIQCHWSLYLKERSFWQADYVPDS